MELLDSGNRFSECECY